MAVTLTAAELEAAARLDTAAAARLLPVVTELVQEYAPDAPDAVANEAAIRAAGWLAEQPGASIRSERVGDIQTGYFGGEKNALRSSGGMALLTRWKQRRGGKL